MKDTPDKEDLDEDQESRNADGDDESDIDSELETVRAKHQEITKTKTKLAIWSSLRVSKALAGELDGRVLTAVAWSLLQFLSEIGVVGSNSSKVVHAL